MEWCFFENMMVRFGFSAIWITKIMGYLKSVSYNFLHDDVEFGEVKPQLSVWQGDPISPYIYILCAEGLSSIIRRNEDDGLLHGCTIVRGAPTISHLLFADDCYLFFKSKYFRCYYDEEYRYVVWNFFRTMHKLQQINCTLHFKYLNWK